jgi:hypothetical protein
LADPRWKICKKYIQLQLARNSVSNLEEQMFGTFNPCGWGAYFRKGHLFVKKAAVQDKAKYPDFGCNFEVYSDAHSLELETLGPLQDLNPGQTAEHTEQWGLFNGIQSGEDERWIDSVILPAARSVK